MLQADSDQAVNPFTSRGSTPSFAHCIWEALKGRSDGLSVQDIANVMQEQNLRDMSNLKNPAGQVVQQAVVPLQSHMHTNIWNICQELCMCGQLHVSAGLRVRMGLQVSNVIGRNREHFAHAASSNLWLLA